MAWQDRWELQDARRPGRWDADRQYSPWPRGYRDELRTAREEREPDVRPSREGRDDGGHPRREIDPPWVEAGPRAREEGRTRGMYEWEDRGPLEWLGDKVRKVTGRGGRGPRGYQRSDDRIRDEVCERLARSGLDVEDVEVNVENREVTLLGTVPTRADKWRLEDLAEEVYGVEDVHCQLRARQRPSERDWRP